MRLLAIVSGEYGRRHVANIRAHAPADWSVEMWQAPAVLPPVIDYPEDYLPDQLPAADLILAFGEHPGIAELIPEIARITGAQAVIAAVDNEAWLPRGLARQLADGWRIWVWRASLPSRYVPSPSETTGCDDASASPTRIR